MDRAGYVLLLNDAEQAHRDGGGLGLDPRTEGSAWNGAHTLISPGPPCPQTTGDCKRLAPVHHTKVQNKPEAHAEGPLRAKTMITGSCRYRQPWREWEGGRGELVGKRGGVSGRGAGEGKGKVPCTGSWFFLSCRSPGQRERPGGGSRWSPQREVMVDEDQQKCRHRAPPILAPPEGRHRQGRRHAGQNGVPRPQLTQTPGR